MTEIDPTVPHLARVRNYWLGGTHNYEVDRRTADRFTERYPGFPDMCRAYRSWLARAVRHLAGDAGIRQFLDIGTGLPVIDSTHEVAQRVAPQARTVYVEHDPLLLAQARALLTNTSEGVTDYINADLQEPEKILDAAGRTLDFTRPIALMLMAMLGCVADDDAARSIVRRLLGALPSGSYLMLYDGTDTHAAYREAIRHFNGGGSGGYHPRSPTRIAAFFDGLELLEPGVVQLHQWRPEPTTTDHPDGLPAYCGLAYKR